MKKRIWIAFITVALLALSACGKSADTASALAAPQAAESGYAMSNQSYDRDYPMEDYAVTEELEYKAEPAMEMPAADPGSGNTGRAYSGDVKLIYRADLFAETTDLDKTITEVEKLTESLGGYIESSDRSNYSHDSYISRFAYYVVRIPQEKYNAFLDTFSNSGICTVTNLSKSTTDVGAEYADNEAHLETCRIKQNRLQELLKQAENMEDLIAIENALTDVEYQIEYYSSALNRYDALINFSTISLYVEQVQRESKTAGEGSLGEKISASFSNGIAAFVTGLEDLIIAIAGAIIPLLIFVVIVAIVVVIIVKACKGRKTRKSKKKEEPKENGQ